MSTYPYNREIRAKYSNYSVPHDVLRLYVKAEESIEEAAISVESLHDTERPLNETSTFHEAFKGVLNAKMELTSLSQLVQKTGSLIDEHSLAVNGRQELMDLDAKRQVPTLQDTFDEFLQEYLAERESRPESERLAPAQARFKTYVEKVWNSSHDVDLEMPPVESLYSDYNDEIEVSSAVADFKCPLTKTYLEDPVKSRKCEHAFSRQAILDLLRERKDDIENKDNKCPVPACSQTIFRKDLVGAPELVAKTNARKKRDERKRRELEANSEVL